MREGIGLYRGKRKDNSEWIEGALTIDDFIENGEIKRAYCIKQIPDNVGGKFEWVQVDPETVGQYTSVTDKNCKKIFEGDIVRYSTNSIKVGYGDIHEVVFETRGGSGYFGITISNIETWAFCLEVPAKLMEIIGNIHDTPELLKNT